MVGTHKGLVSFLKKEMSAKEIRNKLVFCHCIVHQQSLCAKSVKFDHVVSVVTFCLNFEKRPKQSYIQASTQSLMLTTTIFFIFVLFVAQVMGICLSIFIFFCQKSSSLQI